MSLCNVSFFVRFWSRRIVLIFEFYCYLQLGYVFWTFDLMLYYLTRALFWNPKTLTFYCVPWQSLLDLDLCHTTSLYEMMTSEKKCCVSKCVSEKEILHKFPNPTKDIDRFRTWIYNIGGDILALKDDVIFKSRRVCHIHFEPRYYTRSKFLSADAVPRLCLPESTIRRQPLRNITNQSPGTTVAEETPPQQHQELHDLSSSITKRNIKKVATNERLLAREIKKLKTKNDSYQMRLKKAVKLSTNTSFQSALKKFKTLAALFIAMQFREISKPKMGRKYTKEEKIMALSLYKVGPKAYRWLSKIFVLPSPVSLSRIISRASLKPGINESIFETLKRKVEKMKHDEKLCTLVFDEMALSPHFDYNPKKDKILDFVNYTGTASRKIADHVLVFMIRGVIKNYKQPIYYSFCAGSTPKEILAVQIKEVIQRLQSIGFIVIATVCDQGTSNTSAINYLIEETRKNYIKENKVLNSNYTFEIEGKQIIPLFDVPHLLKGLRNNLMTKNLIFQMDGETKEAKWEHIMQLYENNPTYKGLKIIKNLNENHCNKDKIPKMKVKYATQLFSQTVGKTMGYLAENGILPEECKDTADFIIFIDNLFDSLNGSLKNSNVRSGKDLLKNVTPKSKHHNIWLQAKVVLRSMMFVTPKARAGTIPSITNWIKTIENMLYLREKLFNEYNILSFWCRHFNQDPLENFFGSVRSHSGRNTSPSSVGFENAFATLLINNMSNYSSGSNCEEDFCEVFQSFDEIFFQQSNKINQTSDVDLDLNDLIENDSDTDFDTKIKNPRIIGQLVYVTGYILRKSRKIFKKCIKCKEILFTNDPDKNKYLQHREYVKGKKFLCYPSENFTKCFSDIQDVLHHILRSKSHIENLKMYLKTILYTKINIEFINCSSHNNELVEYIFDFSSKFFCYNWCKWTNKLLNGTSTTKDVDLDDQIQQQASSYYLKRRKNK